LADPLPATYSIANAFMVGLPNQQAGKGC